MPRKKEGEKVFNFKMCLEIVIMVRKKSGIGSVRLFYEISKFITKHVSYFITNIHTSINALYTCLDILT